MERAKVVYLTTAHLKPSARDKAIEKVTVGDFDRAKVSELGTADEVWLRHQGRSLIVKYRGMNRAARANA